MSGIDNKILERCQKLLNMTMEHGCTAEEAAAAAVLLQKTLATYQLSMIDVENHRYKEDIIEIRRDTDHMRVKDYIATLADKIGEAFDCRTLIGRRWDKNSRKYVGYLVYIGRESDVKIADYFLTWVFKTLTIKANENSSKFGYRGGDKILYRESFMRGAAYAICDRMKAEKAASYGGEEACTAMVLIKNAGLDRYMAEKHPGIGVAKLSGSKQIDSNAYWDGHEEGTNMSLAKGINGENEDQKRIE